MSTQLLFLCPHAAAKSVLAMTYCASLAQKHQLSLQVTNAGTEPDEAIHPAVAHHLTQLGHDLTGFIPPRLTAEQLQRADIVISIGCITADTVPEGTLFLDWSEVPNISDGFEAADADIARRVDRLIDWLLNSAADGPGAAGSPAPSQS